jgi:phosphoserine phosphatase
VNGKNMNTSSQRYVSIYISCVELKEIDTADNNKITTIVLAELAEKKADLIKFQKLIINNQYNNHILLAYPKEQVSIASEINELTTDIASRLKACCSDTQCHFVDSTVAYNEDYASHRFVLTLMAKQISADLFNAVIDLLVKNNIFLYSINSLSDESASIQNHNNIELAQAYELELLIEDIDTLNSLAHQLAELASQQSVDASIQPMNIFREQKRLACFDMDSTLIQAEVIDELAKEAGVGEQVAQITESAMRGELDFNQSFIKRMSLLEGLDEAVLEKVAERLVLSDGVEILFAALNRLGYKTAILSGGFDYYARFLQKKLGIDYIYANELNIVEGKLTGKVLGEIVNGDKKAALLQTIAKQEKINLEQVIAVGDGANDLPMLALAGLGVAFKAKPLVKASAKYSIDNVGLDGVLYMLGLNAQQIKFLIK